MRLLKLVESKVKVGQPLPWNVRDNNGRLLLACGHVIPDEYQLEALLDRGAFVDAEEVKALMATAPVVVPPKQPLSLFDEWKLAQDELEAILTPSPLHVDFLPRLIALAERIPVLVQRDPDIAIYAAVRRHGSRQSIYGLTHSLHTALVCFLASQRLGWPPQQIQSLIRAALTMNLSIIGLQGELATREDPLTPQQRTEIRQHPEKSVALLQQAGVTDIEWLQAVAEHHEQADGKGYPQGLTDICSLARALHYADVFMAKVSPRMLQPKVSVQESARDLYKEDEGGPFAAAIIKEFGIYPPGNFVELKSGELGLVMRRGSKANLPIVATVTDKSGIPSVQALRRDTAQPEYAIVGPAKRQALAARIPPERIYGLLPAGKESAMHSALLAHAS